MEVNLFSPTLSSTSRGGGGGGGGGGGAHAADLPEPHAPGPHSMSEAQRPPFFPSPTLLALLIQSL